MGETSGISAAEWKEKLSRIRDGFSSALSASDAAGLEPLETRYFGRKGELTLLLRDLKDFSIEEKKELGALGNAAKAELAGKFEARKLELGGGAAKAGPSIDLTLSGYPFASGSLHPLTQTVDKLVDSFARLGFSLAEGPNVEEDYYNFEALNFPPDHPARDMQDTFYVGVKDASGKDMLLRTHTSPVQVRAMKSAKPPLRRISVGRVFRSEAVDASHSFAFHQMEAFCLDRNVTMADLKWTLEAFLKDVFGSSAEICFSPSYFPFVEPGAQVAVSCVFCKGKNAKCPVCKGTGWLEMLGAGIIHPNVLRACGHDPEKWSGFALGAGIERFAMLLFGISDMRMLYENDLRILKQL